jgi:hypothetical protein
LSPPPPEALLDPQSSQPIKFPSPTATVAVPTDHGGQQQHQHINPNVRPSPQQHDHSIFSITRRSLDEDEDIAGPSSSHRTVTLADISDMDIVLARLAERHFREGSVHELDTLATFLALVKNSANGKCPLHARFQLNRTLKSILSEANLVESRERKYNDNLISPCPVVFVDRRHGCECKKSALVINSPNLLQPPSPLLPSPSLFSPTFSYTSPFFPLTLAAALLIIHSLRELYPFRFQRELVH